MGYSAFKMNGVPVKNPSKFKVERYNVTNLTRLASAKMTGDLIAKKHKFFFTYEAITSRDLDTILGAIWDTNTIFFTLEYAHNGATKTAQVYTGAIPSELHNAATGDWVWKNVSFDLIEQ